MKKKVKKDWRKSPAIILKNERKETFYRYDAEVVPWMYAWYVEEGLKRIKNDIAALFNYGVNAVLMEKFVGKKKGKK